MMLQTAILSLLATVVHAHCPTGYEEVVVDFDSFTPGAYVGFLPGLGVSVSARGGLKTKPRVYDTDTAGFGNDPDLEVGMGNCLIIQEDNRPDLTPDDNQNGGFIDFTYNNGPVLIHSAVILDAESGGRFVFKDENGDKIPGSYPIPSIADGEVEEVDLFVSGVMESRVVLVESGALCELTYCIPPPPVCPSGMVVTPFFFDYDVTGHLDHGDYTTSSFGPFEIDVIHSRAGSYLGAPSARIYNSNLSGGEDPDLEVGLGNIVIIQENNGSPFPPDDNEKGGTIVFEFNAPTTVVDVGVIDYEEKTKFKYYDGSDNRIGGQVLPSMSDGDNQVIPVGVTMSKLEVSSNGSGGIYKIIICQ